MGHFDITLNHITAILSSIIIGVGVDFAIHFISQFQRFSSHTSRNDLSHEVIQDVGYPIILDAGSNIGFGALLSFSFRCGIKYGVYSVIIFYFNSPKSHGRINGLCYGINLSWYADLIVFLHRITQRSFNRKR